MRSAALLLALAAVGCAAAEPATPEERMRAQLEDARAAWRADPHDEQAIIWYGRRLAYLGHHQEAVEVYTHGLRVHPDSHRLLRHRGHRWITLRRFDLAEEDLERAAERIRRLPDAVEPDGMPNAAGIPRSTTHSNVLYHLGLARWLQGDPAGSDGADGYGNDPPAREHRRPHPESSPLSVSGS